MIRGDFILIMACTIYIACESKEGASSSKPASGPLFSSSTSGGVAMKDSSPGNGDISDHQPTRFAIAGEKYIFLKVADARNKPSGPYLGKTEFEKTVGKNQILLHLLIPGNMASPGGKDKISQIVHTTSDKREVLNTPSRLFRSPNSPLITYLVIDFGSPGTLSIFFADSSSPIVFQLLQVEPPLFDLHLSWTETIPATISYQNIPKFLWAEMPK